MRSSVGPVYKLALLGAALLGPSALNAQSRIEASVGAAGLATRLSPEDPLVTDALSGFLLGGEAHVRFGRFSAHVRYADGRVESTRLDVRQDVVEGEFLLGISPIPWLTLKLGPHARSFTFADGTRRRWFFWEGRLRGEARLLDETLRSYVEAWKVIGGNVSGSDPFDYGQGGEGGIELRLATSPIWARLAYRIERGRLTIGRTPQTIEQLLIGVGVTVK